MVILKFSTMRVPDRLHCVFFIPLMAYSCILSLCAWKSLANSLTKHLCV